jgi:hypothetical protein
MVSAHADGMLSVYPLPSPFNGAGGGPEADVDASCPEPGGSMHSWQPRAARVRAHRGGLVAAAALVPGRGAGAGHAGAHAAPCEKPLARNQRSRQRTPSARAPAWGLALEPVSPGPRPCAPLPTRS